MTSVAPEIETNLSEIATVDPFTAAFMSYVDEPHPLPLAHAICDYWRSLTPIIKDDDLIVGRIEADPIAGFNFGAGIFCDVKRAEEWRDRNPDGAAAAERIIDFWRGRTTSDAVQLSDDERHLQGHNVYWAGWGGHAILGFDEVLAGGVSSIRERIGERFSTYRDGEERAFLEALLIVSQGICDFAASYAAEARALANRQSSSLPITPRRRSELLELAEICDRVPKNGARSFREALQSFWFIHLLDGTDSPGRFDQYMLPYYERDVKSGEITREEAQSLLDHLWKRFNDVRSWNLCISGLRPDGGDGTNELTYMCLEAAKRCGKVAPNLSLRLHADSPDQLLDKALEVIATGIGMPALYNDDVMVPALMRYGIPAEHARDYAMNGCSQIDIQGKSHIGLEDGELSLLKCLELALSDGFDPFTDRQLGPCTGRSFDSHDELLAAYKKQVEYFTERLTQAANAVQKAHAEASPNLFRSLFIEGCIEKGRDFKAGGPLYNHGQVLTQGIANTADALAAIKKLVFDKRRFSLDEVRESLRAVESGGDGGAAWQQMLKDAPKYGNDDDLVDSIAAEIVEHFYETLRQHRTFRGGWYGGGAVVFTRAIPFGAHIGATPDGRRAGETLADSVGPAQGRDKHGPTAMLSSVAKVPQHLALSAYVLNLKLSPSIFKRPEKVAALIKTYFREGGQQIQINVVDRETLEDAKLHPERHQGLIVRVGGFSAYFAQLSGELQDEIISRTEHEE